MQKYFWEATHQNPVVVYALVIKHNQIS